MGRELRRKAWAGEGAGRISVEGEGHGRSGGRSSQVAKCSGRQCEQPQRPVGGREADEGLPGCPGHEWGPQTQMEERVEASVDGTFQVPGWEGGGQRKLAGGRERGGFLRTEEEGGQGGAVELVLAPSRGGSPRARPAPAFCHRGLGGPRCHVDFIKHPSWWFGCLGAADM